MVAVLIKGFAALQSSVQRVYPSTWAAAQQSCAVLCCPTVVKQLFLEHCSDSRERNIRFFLLCQQKEKRLFQDKWHRLKQSHKGQVFHALHCRQGDGEGIPVPVVVFYEGPTGSEVTSWGWEPMEISLRKRFWLISIWLAGKFHPIDVRNNSELGIDRVINQSELPKKVPDLNLIHPKPRKKRYWESHKKHLCTSCISF